jgi:hypothetical protein
MPEWDIASDTTASAGPVGEAPFEMQVNSVASLIGETQLLILAIPSRKRATEMSVEPCAFYVVYGLKI